MAKKRGVEKNIRRSRRGLAQDKEELQARIWESRKSEEIPLLRTNLSYGTEYRTQRGKVFRKY